MKLYNLYEQVILEGLITESVNTDQVVNTIDGEYANSGKKFIRRIRINYDGDDVTDKFGNVTREGKGWRNIVVHAYGKHKSNPNREVIRAYQVYGDSLREPQQPSGWKLFRLDRITHWEPTNLKYWKPIEIDGQKTNMSGDDSMVGEVKVVNFDSKGSDTNDRISPDNRNIDPKADTYRYDNAEPEVDDAEELNNEPTFDDKEEVGVGFDDEKIKAALDEPEPEPEMDYEEEDVEDENDEIKNY